MRLLQSMKIEFYIAPFEADSQLTYLFNTNRAQIIITEDSDLLIFGVSTVFYKMDRNGEGFEIKLENLKNSTEMDFSTFSGDMFLKMCILSGCDYLPSIKSIGLKKSHKLFVEFGDNLPEIINRIKEKLPIDDDYLDNFEKALLTFKFQVVYDPDNREMVNLNDPNTHEFGDRLNKF